MFEFLAVYNSIKHAVFQAVELWAEGDSAVVVFWLCNLVRPNDLIDAMLRDNQSRIKSVRFWRVSHIYREGNESAYWIANQGREGLLCFFNIHCPPADLFVLMQRLNGSCIHWGLGPCVV